MSLRALIDRARRSGWRTLWSVGEEDGRETQIVASMFSAFWSAFSRGELEIADENKTLYSLRHDFNDARKAVCPPSIMPTLSWARRGRDGLNRPAASRSAHLKAAFRQIDRQDIDFRHNALLPRAFRHHTTPAEGGIHPISSSFALDGHPLIVDGSAMAKLWPGLRRMARAPVTHGIVALFLLQTLAFVFSSNGRVVFAGADAGSSIAMAGEICQSMARGDGEPPARPTHHHHCTLCSAGGDGQAENVAAFLARVILVLAPRSDAAPAWPLRNDAASFPTGWTSSWSSRAPPPLS